MDFVRQHLSNWYEARFGPGLFGLCTAVGLLLLLSAI